MRDNAIYTEIKDILMGQSPSSGSAAAQTERDWENDKKVLLPKIIALYGFCQENDDTELLEWTYHFARRIHFHYDHQKKEPGVIEYYEEFEKIQTEAVNYYLDPAVTKQQRLESGRLFKTKYGIIMAGNIPSFNTASICSNCLEPISFGQAICYCCKYPTIGPHGYPTFSILEWKDLEPRFRIGYHAKAFETMDNDIRNRGLNRAWNDPGKDMMPLYVAMGIYPKIMFGVPLD